MTDIKKLNDDFSVAGRITPEDLQQSAAGGFKAVLNLRAPDESGVLENEAQAAEAAGLSYANVPLSPTTADADEISKALLELEKLPKPILVHCGLGSRAGAIALISTAINHDWTLEQLTESANELSVPLEQPYLKQFIQKTFSKTYSH